MRLVLILCTLCAALCLASALGQPDAPTKSSASGYPKKVTTLKKRPTKTPSTTAITSSSSAGASPATTKPSKPRTKFASASTSASKKTTTKAPSLAASFGNLPADDLEFIKELDKQFKLHGNKIKIKVERENTTSSNDGGSGKNNKRTIDGELGYGYAHQGYDYTPPKYMFYPYSQHDIPATESPDVYAGYSPADYEQPGTTQAQQQPIQHQQVTSVTIEPSYSYELKPQTSYETQQPVAEQHAHAEQPQIDLPQPHHESSGTGGDVAGYQEPVIVLRIPGPAKYAAHLQTLLQQYLEIRAAQYLQLLQEAEQRKQHQSEELPPQSYDTPEQHEQAHYHPDVTYAHQVAPTPPPIQYAPIDDVYQTYKGRHQQSQAPQYEQPAAEAYYAPTGYQQQQPQFYYAQPQQQTQYESSYQPQLYLIAMTPQAQYAEPSEAVHHQQHQQQQQQQPIYVPEQEPPTAPEVEPAGHDHELPITENNPRPTHTKVIFNSQSSGAADYASSMYDLPSIRPYAEHQHQQQHQQQQAESGHTDVAATPADYQPSHEPAEAMAITQPPYNYHAHGLKMSRQQRQGKRAAKAEHAADQQLQQIREYVREKLGAEMGSAVEYKTTQLLEG
ncbi:chromatin modification-related protein eaf-1 [Drosophila novamexicana]|uniref:chromatin modification-related protein eaf-1 n=1 Tax=Drosophila novamexicana TaxID=47314 RepID=UPI0011E5DBEC|nr:chromatin modification-related protein eaf-1 [Drosophila novamexicana]